MMFSVLFYALVPNTLNSPYFYCPGIIPNTTTTPQPQLIELGVTATPYRYHDTTYNQKYQHIDFNPRTDENMKTTYTGTQTK